MSKPDRDVEQTRGKNRLYPEQRLASDSDLIARALFVLPRLELNELFGDATCFGQDVTGEVG